MKTAKTLLTMALVCVVSASVMAADEKKAERKKGAAPAAVQLPKDIELTADQKEKLAAVNKEYAEKFAAATKAVDDVLTEDQKKARTEAQKDARANKKGGKEAKEAIDAAVKITDDQKEKYKKATEAFAAVQLEALKKVGESLTADQKAKIPQLTEKKGKKAEKKPAAK